MGDTNTKRLDNRINALKFIIYSFIGIFMFFISIELGGKKLFL